MKAVVGTAYCGNIEYYSVLKNADSVLLDVCEHFEKQSYRNRACIHGANGLLNLIIPLNRRGIRIPIKEATINNEEKWQTLHWRSFEAAYRSSPYFEYYEYELKPFYENKYEKLFDFNNALQNKIIELLGISVTISETSAYEKEHVGFTDFRHSIHPKIKPEQSFPKTKYIQVFEDRNDFIPNLSILDLLFNEGPNAVTYL